MTTNRTTAEGDSTRSPTTRQAALPVDLADRPSPYLTTNEAAAYLRYRSAAGIRAAVRRGDLAPAGIGPRGTYLFIRRELDRFVKDRGSYALRLVSPGSIGETNEVQLSRHQKTGPKQVRGAVASDRPTNRQRKGLQTDMQGNETRSRCRNACEPSGSREGRRASA